MGFGVFTRCIPRGVSVSRNGSVCGGVSTSYFLLRWVYNWAEPVVVLRCRDELGVFQFSDGKQYCDVSGSLN
ncbi:hypothetical protein RchiOBHm_Chr7g0208521 [Rosa chinensis]|uniref:Uncharacterized protein n=1 Tax=Rosa chinensis TaxID=74649 RepID=A0A2P6P9T2_ROSCH|nr:hypothetical protein RchiOBHm_Chr7g0208521 [Rosa chinensis]